MRKLIYGINLSIDGCCDHTKMGADEVILEYFAQQLREADTLVYGRITYQLMVPFWPEVAKSHSGPTKAFNDFADAFDSVKEIVVVSKTLEQPEGKNTRIIRSNFIDEILQMKQEQGKEIMLGGVAMPSQLMKLDLIDEYRFVIHPVLVGEGRRLFEDIGLPEGLQLKLKEVKTLNSRFVALHYSKK